MDLSELASGHSLHMSHLKMPNGVELSGLHGADPTVVTILGAKVEVVEGGEAPAA